METKVCNKCGMELPATLEYYYKCKNVKSGLTGACKCCTKAIAREWNNNNKERKTKKSKEYYKNNKDIINEKCRIYNHKNKELLAKIHSEYVKNNREKVLEGYKRHYRLNRERILDRKKRYDKQYPELANIKNQRRRSKKSNLKATLTTEQWNAIKEQFENKCCYCGKELPLTQEHFIPVDKSGPYTHNNIIPSCKSCNSSKGAKDFFEWYPKYCYYSKKREKKILDFLGYKDNSQQLRIG